MIAAVVHHHTTLAGGLGVAGALSVLAALPAVPALISSWRRSR